MSERKQVFMLCTLGLMLAIMLFAVVLTTNLIKLENLELNKHILEDCKIDLEEYQSLKQPDEVKF